MKKIFTAILFSAGLFLNTAIAQCPIIPPVFGGCPPTGGLCGGFDTAMANQPYQSVINFYMPKKLTDPGTLSQCQCSYVELKTIKISGIGGLPTGLNYTFNKSQAPYKGYYDVANNDTLGSATICGTPLSPGSYPVTVYIEANVLAVGTPIGNVDPGPQNQTYQGTMIVLPDTSGGVGSFNFLPKVKEDCDSLKLDFEGILAAPYPNPTSYVWNFGNGNTSIIKDPVGTQNYTTPGDYPVSLRTTYYSYRVKKVVINTISGGYTGDIEELTTVQDPDPYVKFNSLGYSNRGNGASGKTNINFNNINKVITPGTTSIDMELWDEDNGPPFGSADDLLGTYTLSINPNIFPLQVNFSNNNANGYVEFDTVATTIIVDTLHIAIKGRPAIPSVLSVADTFCDMDTVDLTLSNSYTNATYMWYKDGVDIPGAADSTLKVTAAANYSVKVTDAASGCSSTSANKQITYMQNPPDPISVIFNQAQMKLYLGSFISPSLYNIVWYKDGLEIPGQTTSTISYLGNGDYYAIVSNKAFSSCATTTGTTTVNYNGIEEEMINNAINIYPNPTKDFVNIEFNNAANSSFIYTVADIYGRNIISETTINSNKTAVNFSDKAKGIYFVTIHINGKMFTKKLVVE